MIRLTVRALLVGILVASPAYAQAPATDPVRELLTEVRALRIAMERSTTVGARIQLLVARVQLQEQRIAELSRRAIAVREEMSRLDASILPMASMVKRFEGAGANVSAEDRAHIEIQLEQFRAQLAGSEKRRQELVNEDAMLSQQLATDQGRWSDVNGQLDDLERSLVLPIKQ